MSNAVFQPDAGQVLYKAFFNAIDDLHFSQQDAAKIIGVDRSSISKMKQKHVLSATDAKGERALLFLRCYRALYALMGGNVAHMRHWMETENHYFKAQPKCVMHKIEGLVTVCHYLDAMRAKV